jgi:hypothetical protein
MKDHMLVGQCPSDFTAKKDKVILNLVTSYRLNINGSGFCQVLLCIRHGHDTCPKNYKQSKRFELESLKT